MHSTFHIPHSTFYILHSHNDPTDVIRIFLPADVSVRVALGVGVGSSSAARVRSTSSAVAMRETCAVRVEAEFRFPRVKQTAAGPRRMQTPRPTTRQVPDGDKLLRAVLDALTGAIYVDDAQVIEASTRKTFVEREGDAGLFLRVTELPD